MLNGLGVDILAIDIELIEDRDITVWPSDWKSGDRVFREGVLCDGAIFIRQLSMSPVAPGCTIDDDSNGSIAHDCFNLAAP
jgi:hypothetical protein